MGDAEQSIFGFTKKDSKYLLSLAKSPGFKLFPITFNHRCHPSIVNYSTAFVADPAEELELLETNEIRVFEKCCIGDASTIAAWIEQVLPAIEAEFGITRRSGTGILVRSNISGTLVSRALTIPHRNMVSHPLEEHSSLWARLFVRLLSHRFNGLVTAREIVDDFAYRMKPVELTNVRKLVRAIRTCSEKQLFEKIQEVAKMILPNAENQTAVDLLLDSDMTNITQSFSPAEDDQLQILSIHKSKGLEFDLIFHLDLYEWVLPAKRPGPDNDFNNPEYPEFDQDQNLHYVAVTRARKACFLCYSTRRINSQQQSKAGAPSEFLQYNVLGPLRHQSSF